MAKTQLDKVNEARAKVRDKQSAQAPSCPHTATCEFGQHAPVGAWPCNECKHHAAGDYLTLKA